MSLYRRNSTLDDFQQRDYSDSDDFSATGSANDCDYDNYDAIDMMNLVNLMTGTYDTIISLSLMNPTTMVNSATLRLGRTSCTKSAFDFHLFVFFIIG